MKSSGELNPFSTYGIYAHAMKGFVNPNKYNQHLQPRDPADFARMANGIHVPPQYPGGVEYDYGGY